MPRRQTYWAYQIIHHALEKMLKNVEPTGYQQCPGERPRPKLGPFLKVIDQILEDDKTAPKKQRHSTKRIFDQLRDEHGYSGSAGQVRTAMLGFELCGNLVFEALRF